MALQLRRGTNAQRLAVTPLDGELIFVTDWQAADVNPVWIGDGATVGGIIPMSLDLTDLKDVTIFNPQDLDILQYDTATSEWINVSNPEFLGIKAGNITVGLADDNTITTTAGNLVLSPASGVTSIPASLAVDTNTLYVSSTDNKVGILNTTPVYPLDVTGVARATGGVNASLVKIGMTSTGTIDTISGDLTLDAATNLVRINASAIIQGDLTVDGDLTYLNVADLQVEDKNIIIAKGSTTDAAADGGGLTLKGATDKTITWSDGSDRWQFNNGDGVQRPFVINANDLSDVEISSTSKGQLLVNDGAGQWRNTSSIEFDNIANRPSVINAVSGASISALDILKNTGSAVTDGNTVAQLFGHINASTRTYTHRLSSEYDTAGNHMLRIQVDPVGNFASGSTTAYSQLRIDNNYVAINGNELRLGLNNTTAVDAQITVERGSTGADAYIKWDEAATPADSQWFISNPTQVGGRLSVIGNLFTEGGGDLYLDGNQIILNNGNAGTNASITVDGGVGSLVWDDVAQTWTITNNVIVSNSLISVGDLGTNGYNIFFNNDDGTPSSSDNANLVVKRGSGVDVSVRWNESTDRWQFTNDGSTFVNMPVSTDSPVYAGITAGNITVGVTNDNIITTSTGDLTIDCASGSVKVDSSLEVLSTTTTTGLTIDSNIPFIRMGTGTYGLHDFGAITATTTTSTTTTDLGNASWSASVFRSVEFTLQATKGTEFQIVKGIALHDGTNTYINTYSDIRTGASDLFAINATLAAGSFKLQVTSASATSTVYKGSYTVYTI